MPTKLLSRNLDLCDLRSGQFRDLPIIAIDDQGSREGHLGSDEVAIRLSPITRDRMEIETLKWCQMAWLVEPLR